MPGNDFLDYALAPPKRSSFDPANSPYLSFSQLPIGNIGGALDTGYQFAAARGWVPRLYRNDRETSGLSRWHAAQQQATFQRMLDLQAAEDTRILTQKIRQYTQLNETTAGLFATGAVMTGKHGMVLTGGALSQEGMTSLMRAAGTRRNSFRPDEDTAQAQLNAFNAYFGFKPGQEVRMERTAGLTRDELAAVTNFSLGRMGSTKRALVEASFKDEIGKAVFDSSTAAWTRALDTAGPVDSDTRLRMNRAAEAELRKGSDPAAIINAAVEAAGADTVESERLRGVLSPALSEGFAQEMERRGYDSGGLSNTKTMMTAKVLAQSGIDEYTKLYAELGDAMTDLVSVLDEQFGKSAALDPARTRAIGVQLKALANVSGESIGSMIKFLETASNASTAVGGRRLTAGESMRALRLGTAMNLASEDFSQGTRQTLTDAVMAASSVISGSSYTSMLTLLESGSEEERRLAKDITSSLTSDDQAVRARGKEMMGKLMSGVVPENYTISEATRNAFISLHGTESERRIANELARSEAEKLTGRASRLPDLRRRLSSATSDDERARLSREVKDAELAQESLTRLQRQSDMAFNTELDILTGITRNGEGRSVGTEIEGVRKILADNVKDFSSLTRTQQLAIAASSTTLLDGVSLNDQLAAQLGMLGVDFTGVSSEAQREIASRGMNIARIGGPALQARVQKLGIVGLQNVAGSEKAQALVRAKIEASALENTTANVQSLFSRILLSPDDGGLKGIGDAALEKLGISRESSVVAAGIVGKLAAADDRTRSDVQEQMVRFSMLRERLQLTDDAEERARLIQQRDTLGAGLRKRLGVGETDEAMTNALDSLLGMQQLYTKERPYAPTKMTIDGTIDIPGLGTGKLTAKSDNSVRGAGAAPREGA